MTDYTFTASAGGGCEREEGCAEQEDSTFFARVDQHMLFEVWLSAFFVFDSDRKKEQTFLRVLGRSNRLLHSWQLLRTGQRPFSSPEDHLKSVTSVSSLFRREERSLPGCRGYMRAVAGRGKGRPSDCPEPGVEAKGDGGARRRRDWQGRWGAVGICREARLRRRKMRFHKRQIGRDAGGSAGDESRR